MNNPRDFLPAKYKRNDAKKVLDPVEKQHLTDKTSNSPWSNLAQEPQVPSYRSVAVDLDINSNQSKTNSGQLNFGSNLLNSSDPKAEPSIPSLSKDSSSASDSITQTTPALSSPKLKSKTNNKKLAGLFVLFFLVIGVFSSFLLAQQNQDGRQQASAPTHYMANARSCADFPNTHLEERGGVGYCMPNTASYFGCSANQAPVKDSKTGEISCITPSERGGGGDEPLSCSLGFKLVKNLITNKNFCVPENSTDTDNCDGSGISIGTKGNTWCSENCRNTSENNIICGYTTNLDACTSESMGGDWCDNPSTTNVETCEDAGLMRCRCGGTGNGWWVIGKAASCSALCSNANAVCTNCETDDNPPEETGKKLNCGEFGCNSNADCNNGLTCQPVNQDGVAKKICAKGENQLFCAALPNASNCCESQAMPVCSNIEMLDTNLNPMTKDDDKKLKNGDEVRFRCSASGNQNVKFNYEFRILPPGSNNWLDITNQGGPKDMSKIYTLKNFGQHTVQGRICVGTECQVWEAVN